MLNLLVAFLVALAVPSAPPPSSSVVVAEVVCVLSCDTLDPSRARQETFPVPEKQVNGRRLVLHVSDRDGMGQHRQRRHRRLGVAGPVVGRRRELGGLARQGERPRFVDRHQDADVQRDRPRPPPARPDSRVR
ncbi:hypothetical protein [Lentzea sp.]|uniref:hypothetical protein n=1 Tax=Lentzea sp. TaxID=56099 RepID=UPI002CFCE239|nr:hypothetical protein [Lentzea sp.]HUQ62061.1 hypothetical protein [Lentzea sp.]